MHAVATCACAHVLSEREHVEASADESAADGARVRLALEQTDTRGDTDTADIGIEISWGVDTYRWFVEAHLGLPARQETRPRASGVSRDEGLGTTGFGKLGDCRSRPETMRIDQRAGASCRHRCLEAVHP